MKLKYHKIRGVDLSVCTCEQKIAYNIAFRLHISYQKQFNSFLLKNPFASAVSEAVDKMVRIGIEQYTSAYDYKPEKYNIDAIFSALQAGLKNYLSNFRILSSYEEIGKAFPAYYL